MPVEVAREGPLERAVVERELERIRTHERGPRAAAAGEIEHLLALVDAKDLAAQASGDEPGATGDIERQLRLEGGNGVHHLVPLLRPSFGHGCKEALSEPPVVVLG